MQRFVALLRAMLHHLSYAAPFWARLHSTKLRCTHLTYTELFRATCWATLWLWATMHLLGARLHPTELRCIQRNYAAPSELPPFIRFFKMPYLSVRNHNEKSMVLSPVPECSGTWLRVWMFCIVMYAKVVVAHVVHFYQTMYLDVNTLVYTQPQYFTEGLFQTPTNASMPMPAASAKMPIPWTQ